MYYLLYTVQSSDESEGLLGIAQRIYNDSARWTLLFEANRSVLGANPNVVRSGQHLIVPAVDPASAEGGPVAAQIYVVEPRDVRDGLLGIARRLYNNPERWQALYAVNRGSIGDNPQHLQPGQRLLLP